MKAALFGFILLGSVQAMAANCDLKIFTVRTIPQSEIDTWQTSASDMMTSKGYNVVDEERQFDFNEQYLSLDLEKKVDVFAGNAQMQTESSDSIFTKIAQEWRENHSKEQTRETVSLRLSLLKMDDHVSTGRGGKSVVYHDFVKSEGEDSKDVFFGKSSKYKNSPEASLAEIEFLVENLPDCK